MTAALLPTAENGRLLRCPSPRNGRVPLVNKEERIVRTRLGWLPGTTPGGEEPVAKAFALCDCICRPSSKR